MPELVKADKIILKGLLCGAPGAGKTSILATANDVPELAPLLVLDFEGGTLSVAHRGDVYRERIKSMKHLDEVFWKVANKKEGYGDFRCIGIDSGSEMADLCLQEIVSEAFSAAQGNRDLASRDSIDDVQLKDYGKSTRRSTRIFRWFRDLDDVSVIMTALPKERYPVAPASATKEDKERLAANIKLGFIKPVQTVPSFTDKLGTSVLGFLDFCWYVNVIESQQGADPTRQLLTQPVGPFKFIKTRGTKFSAAIGRGVSIEHVPGGSPTINGVPALRFIYDLYLRTEGNGRVEAA